MWTVSEIICLGSLAGLSIADIHYRKVPGEILAMGAVGACVYRICMEQENVWILGGGIAIGILFLFISRVTGEKLGYGDSLAILILGIYMGIWKLLLVLSGAFTLLTIGAVLVLSSRKMYTSIFSFFNRRVFVVSGDRTALNRGQNEAYKIKKSKRKYDGRNVTADADHIVSDIKLYINSILFPR